MKIKFLVILGLFLILEVNSQELFNVDSLLRKDSIELLMPTFRGTAERNFYGWGEVNRLDVIWKFYLGEGITVIGRKSGKRKWKGAGWTGQPLLVREGSDTFLIQGAYDHHLRRINALTGVESWKYKFDDVVKGTGTLWINRKAVSKESSMVIMQGSRLGTQHYLDTDYVPSFRAISYFTGKELWRMNSRLTRSYSRDVDASALVFRDTAYIGLENGVFTVFDPDPSSADSLDGMFQPARFENHSLYDQKDARIHGGNLVTESSPALQGNHIYLASGSGHVYGYNLKTRKIDWDFFTGSDMDGTVVVTSDSCILVSVEKQYIKGKGGVFKLDPGKPPMESVIWYFPVRDTSYASWKGGVIGTVGINDLYTGRNDSIDKLMVVSALDGYTYVVKHEFTVPGKTVAGPSGKGSYPVPQLITKLKTGPSITSPLITSNRIVVSGYNGIYLYRYEGVKVELLDHFGAEAEASPILYGDKLYIASRNGYLYCLGENK